MTFPPETTGGFFAFMLAASCACAALCVCVAGFRRKRSIETQARRETRRQIKDWTHGK